MKAEKGKTGRSVAMRDLMFPAELRRRPSRAGSKGNTRVSSTGVDENEATHPPDRLTHGDCLC